MGAPRVTVLMPMRNAEAFVAEALTSILAQDGPAFEVVVVDDGSTDASRARVLGLGDPRIRLVDGPERGIAAAFNAGLAQAAGEIVMRCDADDRYPPGRLAHQIALLDAHPDCGAVCGGYRSIDPAGRPAADLAQDRAAGDITETLLGGETPTHFCTFAVRRAHLAAIGGCREAFVTAEDIDLQLRLAEAAPVWFDPSPVYDYRLHDASITHVQADARRIFYEDLARRCRRERAAGGPDCVEDGTMPAPPAAGAARASGNQLQGHLLAQAWRQHRAGRRGAALGTGLRALRAGPRAPAAWKNLLALALKRSD